MSLGKQNISSKTSKQSRHPTKLGRHVSSPKNQYPDRISGDSVSFRPNSFEGILLSDLVPYFFRNLDSQMKFSSLIRFSQRVTGDGARKTALRPKRQPVEIDGAASFLDALLEQINVFQNGRFRTDQAKHDALTFWHKSQRQCRCHAAAANQGPLRVPPSLEPRLRQSLGFFVSKK